MVLLTFALLALSISSVWIKASHPSKDSVPLWLWIFFASLGCGMIAGVVNWLGAIVLLALAGMAYLSGMQYRYPLKVLLMLCSMTLALALALHLIPGFNNPLVAHRIKFSADTTPYTLYANFDKGAAGLILLACFSSRIESLSTFNRLIKPIILGILCTIIAVFGTALAIECVHLDLKLPSLTIPFLVINLFLVCVAEEAFFRGVIQEQLMVLLEKYRYMKPVATLASVLLFGIAHMAGGTKLMMLSTLAGVGYALTYTYTRKIEASIAVHFLTNLTHFMLFSYPALATCSTPTSL